MCHLLVPHPPVPNQLALWGTGNRFFILCLENTFHSASQDHFYDVISEMSSFHLPFVPSPQLLIVLKADLQKS